MNELEPVDVTAILACSRPALARAVTLIENERPGAAELSARLAAHCGGAHVVGITGAPGAGKSTLINALLGELTRRGRRIAVVAVDPSSPLSGGALLGDRVRMREHGDADNVFIRSLSARGQLGGLSRTSARVIDVFDAAGFDMVIVETVGAGQSEVDIRHLADTSIVVCPPGLGDEVQALKAGILEIADILVVNKGDLPSAARTLLELESAAHLRRDSRRPVAIVRTVATRSEGVAELVDLIDAHAAVAGRGRRFNKGTPAVAAGATAPGVAARAAAATDDELFGWIQARRSRGTGVALATVVRTWGSSPRPAGSHLAIDAGGTFIGSVSGGCIEGAVITEAQAVIADGAPRMLEYGISDELAWEVGLACGGRVQVFIERITPQSRIFDHLVADRLSRRAVALVTRLSDGVQVLVAEADADGVGESAQPRELGGAGSLGGAGGELTLSAEQIAETRQRLRADRSGILEDGDGALFARCHATAPRLVVIGAVHITQALAPMAAIAGFEVIVVDPRRAFATAERLPDVTLITAWPDEALEQIDIDPRTAIVTLSHDPKLDDPALHVALRSDAFYIGCLGSTRTHAKRVARLGEAGLGDAIARIHAPIGLDLGGRSAAEIAVAILAQVVQARHTR